MRIKMIITIDNFYHYVPNCRLAPLFCDGWDDDNNYNKNNHDCGNDYKYDNNCQYY